MFLFSFYGLTFPFCHFLGKSLFAMFTDVSDASGTVRFEQKSEYLSYEIGVYFALSHILGAFGARMETIAVDA